MSTEKSKADKTTKPVLHTIPENLPEELLPIYDWWKTKGPAFLTALATAAVLAGGVSPSGLIARPRRPRPTRRF